ncbi:selenide, water dikinase SelD, partial [bacterium]|nr:selenide, water dikinase SelD [bacterium]
AMKQGKVSAETIAAATEVMTTLNKGAAEAMASVGAHACTDVTGFGLLGHLSEMVRGSGVGAVISVTQVPVLEEAWSLVRQGIAPGGSRRNLEFIRERLAVAADVGEDALLVLADAQTSGGLLIALTAVDAERLKEELALRNVPVIAEIGEITDDPESRIEVVA